VADHAPRKSRVNHHLLPAGTQRIRYSSNSGRLIWSIPALLDGCRLPLDWRAKGDEINSFVRQDGRGQCSRHTLQAARSPCHISRTDLRAAAAFPKAWGRT
jgi:hypothetical protein